MSQALRKLAGTLNRTDTICIFTNQLREKIGVMFGNPETTPGGRALKFYSSVRLDIRRIETLKDGAEAFGNRVRVKVVKNKVAPPFKQAEFDIIYGSGIPGRERSSTSALETKVVQKAGSYFSFGDERLGQGRQNATASSRENPDLVQQILARIQAEAAEDQIISARLLPSQAAGEAAIEVESDRRRRAVEADAVVARAEATPSTMSDALDAGAPRASPSRSQRSRDRALPRARGVERRTSATRSLETLVRTGPRRRPRGSRERGPVARRARRRQRRSSAHDSRQRGRRRARRRRRRSLGARRAGDATRARAHRRAPWRTRRRPRGTSPGRGSPTTSSQRSLRGRDDEPLG